MPGILGFEHARIVYARIRHARFTDALFVTLRFSYARITHARIVPVRSANARFTQRPGSVPEPREAGSLGADGFCCILS
jgi:hypothetical protein